MTIESLYQVLRGNSIEQKYKRNMPLWVKFGNRFYLVKDVKFLTNDQPYLTTQNVAIDIIPD